MSQTPSRDRIGSRPSGQRTVSRPTVMNRLRNISRRGLASFSVLALFFGAARSPGLYGSVRSYLGRLLVLVFLISGLSYKTTFNRELRISSVPLYSM